MAVKKTLLSAVAIVATAQAQQTAWGQCGGNGWTGPTTCVSGYVCTYSNPWYSQCLPGTQVSTTSASTSHTSSTPTTLTTTTKVSSVSSATTTATASGNPFSGHQFFPDPYYASEISASAIPSLTGTLATKASAVAQVGTFFWMDTAAKVPVFESYLASIAAKNSAGANPPYIGTAVVYDLPDRDCAAAASNGEYSVANNGIALYEQYIDSIAAAIKTYSSTQVVLVIEPDSLANMVTNLSVQKCAQAQAAYYQCVNYALIHLNLPNVAMYIDAGHAGWLGWSANIGPAAQLFGQVYKNASSPAAVRGLATNVANYNGWNLASAPSYTSGDSNYDEMLYVNNLAPLLQQQGFPAHFITDVSRNGVQPTSQNAWGDWCNVINTGFGVRPTTNTGNSLEDAFVWVKPGGECDGTSNSSSPRYDYHCGYSDALQPAPEAGSWFQAYFVQLLTNANPSF